MNPNVSYGLGVIMMCQGRFIHCNKCTALVEELVMGEALHVSGQEVYENSVLAAQFCCEPKTLLKIKGIDLKKRVRWFMPLYPQRMIGWAWWESEVQNSSCSMLLSYV